MATLFAILEHLDQKDRWDFSDEADWSELLRCKQFICDLIGNEKITLEYAVDTENPARGPVDMGPYERHVEYFTEEERKEHE